MQFGKLARVGAQWKFVSLSDEEVINAMRELRQFNIGEIDECRHKGLTEMEGKTLLEKQLIGSYTFLAYTLDKKINKMRDEIASKGRSYGTYEKKPYVPREEVPQGKSLLNKVYDNLSKEEPADEEE